MGNATNNTNWHEGDVMMEEISPPSFGRDRDDASFAYVWNLADHTFPIPSGFSAPQHEALTVNSHYQKRNRLLFFHIAIIYLVFY